jgi:hypothetical protein
MSVKIYAVIFGLIFLALGIIGFLPQFVPNGYLFGVLSVNSVHNIFYIITGIIGLIVAYNAHASRSFFRIFGVIYLFLALLAFMVGSNFIYMSLNNYDNLFHLIIALIFIYFGFGKPRQTYERPPVVVEREPARTSEQVERHVETNINKAPHDEDKIEKM